MFRFATDNQPTARRIGNELGVGRIGLTFPLFLIDLLHNGEQSLNFRRSADIERAHLAPRPLLALDGINDLPDGGGLVLCAINHNARTAAVLVNARRFGGLALVLLAIDAV